MIIDTRDEVETMELRSQVAVETQTAVWKLFTQLPVSVINQSSSYFSVLAQIIYKIPTMIDATTSQY